jgi:hypothetical protein
MAAVGVSTADPAVRRPRGDAPARDAGVPRVNRHTAQLAGPHRDFVGP